jgi:hypothetical protein
MFISALKRAVDPTHNIFDERQLTPQTRVLPEKLTAPELVK